MVVEIVEDTDLEGGVSVGLLVKESDLSRKGWISGTMMETNMPCERWKSDVYKNEEN